MWGSGQSVREGGDSAELGARQATREQQCSDREERDGALAIRRGGPSVGVLTRGTGVRPKRVA